MFRISRYLKMAGSSGLPRAGSGGVHRAMAPAVIWNLTRTCNLECMHCYASAAPRNFGRELTTGQALGAIEQMKDAGVTGLILSGGEPMLRKDLKTITIKAKEMGFIVALSSNGTLIGDKEADMIRECAFDYVGISLDGIGDIHDRVRGVKGAFDKAIGGLFRVKERGVRAGVRFTLTKINIADLPAIFGFVEENGIEKLYLSHLVYSGRGSANKAEDISLEETRRVMEYVYFKAREYLKTGFPTQIVTGNNDADAVFLLLKLQEQHPEEAERLLPALLRFGGNSAGVGVANIDPTGDVHPDPLMSSVTLGNITETSFKKIWFQSGHPVLKRLREKPRRLNGRCGECAWLRICGGNTRVRAQRLTGDMWGGDPACYLTDEEINMEVKDAV